LRKDTGCGNVHGKEKRESNKGRPKKTVQEAENGHQERRGQRLISSEETEAKRKEG